MQKQPITVLHDWGRLIQQSLQEENATFLDLLTRTKAENPWFTETFQKQALRYWAEHLHSDHLSTWLKDSIPSSSPKTIALILAGNIPLVGMHDLVSCLAMGQRVLVKLSSQDRRLLPYLVELLAEVDTDWSARVQFTTERLGNFDAVIATGSNNTSRYFEYYFKDKPCIIRKNRSSVAVLSGEETDEQLEGLCKDMLDYFGLGCRSVSKLWVPVGYDFERLGGLLEKQKGLTDHNKFGNNFHYHRTVFLMNQIPFTEIGPLLFLEKAENASALSTIHFSYYRDQTQVAEQLKLEEEALQCVVADKVYSADLNWPVIPFGTTQNPALNTYADGKNTLDFLSSL